MKPAYQCLVNRQWVDVSVWIFRSWSGQRRIASRAGMLIYYGPVYLLGKRDKTTRQVKPSHLTIGVYTL